jgi:hypothetical protein
MQDVWKRAFKLWKSVQIYTEDIHNVLNWHNVAKFYKFDACTTAVPNTVIIYCDPVSARPQTWCRGGAIKISLSIRMYEITRQPPNGLSWHLILESFTDILVIISYSLFMILFVVMVLFTYV